MASLSKTLPTKTVEVNRKSSARRPAGPIAAAKAKAHFLQLLQQVEQDRKPVTITKRGRIVAQIVPASEPASKSALDEMFGRSAGMIKITGDIVGPNWDDWGPEWR